MRRLVIIAVGLAAGCAGDAPSKLDAATPDQAAADLAADVADASPCPPATQSPPLARLCVVGAEPPLPEDAGEPSGEDDAGPPARVRLLTDEPVRFVVYPEGCFSSRCAKVPEALCEVTVAQTALTISGHICIAPDRRAPCGTDCEGGGSAECATSAPLAPGSYSATLGDLRVSFTIPSEVAPDALCTGERFPSK